MNDERDRELDQLLSRWQPPDPSSDQVIQWRRAVQTELTKERGHSRPRYFWQQMAAAAAAGFVLGALSFQLLAHRPAPSDGTDDTIAYVHLNAE